MALSEVNILVDISEAEKYFEEVKPAITLLRQRELLDDNALNKILDELEGEMRKRLIVSRK